MYNRVWVLSDGISHQEFTMKGCDDEVVSIMSHVPVQPGIFDNILGMGKLLDVKMQICCLYVMHSISFCF